MTRKEKDSLIKHLDAVVPKQGVIVTDGDPDQYVWLISDVKAAIGDFVEDHKSDIDYKAENKKIMEESKSLINQLHDWQEIAAANEAELNRLRTVVKTIEFISGRKLEL